MTKEYNIEILTQRIDELCAKKRMTRTAVFEKAGVGKNFISNLKNSKPSFQKLTSLANYLGTTVDYLIGNETKEEFADKIKDKVVKWLISNEYTFEETDESIISIGKGDNYIKLTGENFTTACLYIEDISNNGFDLAMKYWTHTEFSKQKSEETLNKLSKQEIELLTSYRKLSIKKQAELIQYLIKLSEN